MGAGQNVVYSMSLRDMVTPGIKGAEKAANSFEGALGRLKGIAVAAFAGWGIKEVISDIVKAGSSVETTRIGLTNMLGSAKTAGEVIANTMKDAAATPFDFEGLLQANKMLIGAQVEARQAREDVLNLANAIAATGGGNDELSRMIANLTQIKNVGKAAAIDIKQFAYANINIYRLLANQMGISTEELKKQLEDGLEITYERITDALKQAHEAGGLYAGGLEAMSNSTVVKISAISDALFQLKVKIFDDLKPAIDIAIAKVGEFITYLSGMWDAVKNSSFISTLAEYFKGIGSIMSGIWDSIQAPLQELFNALAEWKQPLMDLFSFLGVVFAVVLQAIGAILPPLITITTWTIKFLKFIYDILDKLQFFSALKKIFELIGWVVERVFNEIESGYNIVLKPVIDAIGKAYDYLVEILGLTEKISKATPTPQDINGMLYGTKTNANEMVWKSNLPDKPAAVQRTPSKSELGKTTGTKNVAGQKILNINITIGSLVKDFRVVTTNITEGAGKVKDMITKVLTEAINDSQVVAGN